MPARKRPSRDTQLGTSLRAIREAAGLTSPDVARRAGLNRGYLRLIEEGKRGGVNPRWEVVLNLAAALGVGVEKLVPPGFPAGWLEGDSSSNANGPMVNDVVLPSRKNMRPVKIPAALAERNGFRDGQIGARVRAIRERLKVQQKDLAMRASMTVVSLWRREHGEGTTHWETALDLAAALGIGLDRLAPPGFPAGWLPALQSSEGDAAGNLTPRRCPVCGGLVKPPQKVVCSSACRERRRSDQTKAAQKKGRGVVLETTTGPGTIAVSGPVV